MGFGEFMCNPLLTPGGMGLPERDNLLRHRFRNAMRLLRCG